MKEAVKKFGIAIGIVLAIVLVFYVRSKWIGIVSYADKYEGVDLTVEANGLNREGAYSEYLAKYQDAGLPGEDVQINVCDYEGGENVEVYPEYEDAGEVLYTASDSTVTWKVNVPEAGFYHIYLEYMTVESRGVAIERAVYVNG